MTSPRFVEYSESPLRDIYFFLIYDLNEVALPNRAEVQAILGPTGLKPGERTWVMTMTGVGFKYRNDAIRFKLAWSPS